MNPVPTAVTAMYLPADTRPAQSLPTLLPVFRLLPVPWPLSFNSILSPSSSSPICPGRLRTSPLLFLPAFRLAAHHPLIRLIAPAVMPIGGTSQHNLHHHPDSPPCCFFHRFTRRSTCACRSCNVPELSITCVAYVSFWESGSWDWIRLCACWVVRGGFEGRARRRES